MDWLDPETAWLSKLARAAVHLTSLREQLEAFRQSNPYTVTTEPTGTPDRVAYRLHVHETVPTTISTTVGDLVHNLRSALDSLAYEMALSYLGRTLTRDEEAASTFPVRDTPAAFDAFFDKESPPAVGWPIRATMYGQRERAALRAAQPFVIPEEARKHGVDPGSYQDAFRWHPLTRLNRVSNIDKHRRLVVMGWALHLVWWMSDDPTSRRWVGGRRPGRLSDGAILGYMIGTDPDMDDSVFHDFNLVLEDDPAHDPTDSSGGTSDVVSTLDAWHWSVRHSIFAVIQRLSTQ